MTLRSIEPNGHVNVEFDVASDAIDGDLVCLHGPSSLIAMGASVNQKYTMLGFSPEKQHRRF